MCSNLQILGFFLKNECFYLHLQYIRIKKSHQISSKFKVSGFMKLSSDELINDLMKQ